LIEINEVLLKSENNWLHFSKAHKIVSTKNIGDVLDVLREVEILVNQQNWYAAGFISYESAPAFDKKLRVLNSEQFPLIWFGLYPEPKIIETSEVYRNTSKLGDAQEDLRGLNAFHWKPTIEQEVYNTSIEKIKEHIANGKTYQVNYTMRLQSDFRTDTWNFFQQLAQNQNKYAAYINTEEYAICSASPELFFQLDGEMITSRPMKGTVKRGRTTSEDKAQMMWLENSEKNRAENVMIVDMIRNDLGRIAEISSVHVPKLFEIETYPTLFQMTSTVQAKTKASLTEIFSALFPCASITGAPKVSTMKIISELETTPRKIYTGSIGFIAPNRKAQFNVAIRTAIVDKENQLAEYGVGGGIVWDSEIADEYNEAILKARVLAKPYQEFSLLETILWVPSEGYFLLDKHLARMADSAKYFNFLFSEQEFINLLDEIKTKFTSPQRLRVLLNSAGELKYETKDYVNEEKTFKVKLAEKPINSADIFYFHKTTNRGMYPTKAGFDDILLFNEKDELTEFTIGNLVVKMNGELFTPPVSCGLLSGTFRAQLVESGQVVERTIVKNELKQIQEIHLINSVRKWVKVEI